MSTHSEEHEELVRQFLCGERGPEDADLRRLRASCADCRAALERLADLDGTLAALGAGVRTDLARARAEATPAEEARVRRSLEAALGRRAEPVPPARARRLAWVAAAAVLLAALWLVRDALRAPGEPTPEFLLGPSQGAIECLAPLGPGAGYDEFRWRDVRPPSGWFRLTIRPLELTGAEAGRAGSPILKLEVPEARWVPTPEIERSLPAAVLYEVQALDASGRAVPDMRGSAPASR